MATKSDARKLDAATQAHLRRLVVLAVRDGMTQGDAAHKYQVSLRAVNQWVARSKEGGLRALQPQRRGRPRGQGATQCQAGGADPPDCHWQDAKSITAAFLPVDAGGGGSVDCSDLWRPALSHECGAVFEGVGGECPEAGAARL